MKIVQNIGCLLLSTLFMLSGCKKTPDSVVTPAPTTPVPTPVPIKFTPKDTLLGTNFFQVEFSTDSRSMVYCEQLPVGGGQALIWYADVDLNTGLPNLAARQRVDTIQTQGWPYWGHDRTGRFFLEAI